MKRKPEISLEQRSLEFMKTPGKWPAWPFLPLKRSLDQRPCMGLLIESDGNVLPVVILRNLFDYETPLSKCQKVEYDSLEALVADGWRVD